MKNLYNRMIVLIGKPDTSIEFLKLSEDISEVPERIIGNEQSVFLFKNCGLTVYSTSERIRGILISLSKLIESGLFDLDDLDLPFGICSRDTSKIVQTKIGGIPLHREFLENHFFDSYSRDDLSFTFSFDSVNKVLAAVLVEQA